MKKTLLLSQIVATLTLFCSASVYADIPAPPTCPTPGMVHCAIPSNAIGSTAQGAQGKWLLLYWLGSSPITVCMNTQWGGMGVFPSDIQAAIKDGTIKGLSSSSPVDITWLFFQCADQSCLQYKSLGNDTFLLSVTSSGQYSAQPFSYPMAPIDPNYGQTCNATSSSTNLFTLTQRKK